MLSDVDLYITQPLFFKKTCLPFQTISALKFILCTVEGFIRFVSLLVLGAITVSQLYHQALLASSLVKWSFRNPSHPWVQWQYSHVATACQNTTNLKWLGIIFFFLDPSTQPISTIQSQYIRRAVCLLARWRWLDGYQTSTPKPMLVTAARVSSVSWDGWKLWEVAVTTVLRWQRFSFLPARQSSWYCHNPWLRAGNIIHHNVSLWMSSCKFNMHHSTRRKNPHTRNPSLLSQVWLHLLKTDLFVIVLFGSWDNLS